MLNAIKLPGMFSIEDYIKEAEEWAGKLLQVEKKGLAWFNPSAIDHIFVSLPIGTLGTMDPKEGTREWRLSYGGARCPLMVDLRLDYHKDFIENYELFIAHLIHAMENTTRNPKTVRRFFKKLENL